MCVSVFANSEFVVFVFCSVFQYHWILLMEVCENAYRRDETMHVMRVLYMSYIVNGFYSNRAILEHFDREC